LAKSSNGGTPGSNTSATCTENSNTIRVETKIFVIVFSRNNHTKIYENNENFREN
jgi:hypothetical protein